MKVFGILPARLESTRFPKKLLIPIQGKTLLQRSFEAAKKSTLLDQIFIATDHRHIVEVAQSFGASVILTSSSPNSGTERIVEALRESPQLKEASHIINLQADHPFTSEQTIDQLVQLLKKDINLQVATCVKRIYDPSLIASSHVVKCLFDKNQKAIYFSRYPIPYLQRPSLEIPFYQHLGIYGYTTEFLWNYPLLSPSYLELAEGLEQLRFLENGISLKVAIVEDIGQGVDVPEDISLCERILNQEVYPYG